MKKLSDCRVLLVDDAKASLDVLIEGLKADHKPSLALNGEMALMPGGKLTSFEQHVTGFAFADALALLGPATKEPGLPT